LHYYSLSGRANRLHAINSKTALIILGQTVNFYERWLSPYHQFWYCTETLFKLGRVLSNDILLKFDPIRNPLNWDKWLDCKYFCFKRKLLLNILSFITVLSTSLRLTSSLVSDLILSNNKGLEIGKMCDWDWKLSEVSEDLCHDHQPIIGIRLTLYAKIIEMVNHRYNWISSTIS
jgi:hypothetical protein